jgi:hypothetical protein
VIGVGVAACWVAMAGILTRLVLRRLPVLAPVALGIGAGLVLVFLVVTFFDVPLGSGTDEVVYQSQAEAVSRSLSLTGDVTSRYAVLDEGKYGWPAVLGTVYWLSGADSPYLGIFLNGTVTYMALLLVAAVGQRLFPTVRPNPLHVALMITAPAVLMFGVSLMREPWAWLAIAIGMHSLLSAQRGRRAEAIGLLLVACAAAFWIRTPLAVIIVGAWGGGLFVSWVYRRTGPLGAVAALTGCFVAGLQVLVPILAAAGYSPQLLLIARDYLAAIASTGFVSRDPFTIVGMIEALVRVGVGPLPWEYRPSPVWGWIFLNQVHWLVVAGLALLAWRRRGGDAARVALLAFCVVLLAGIAIGLTNYGIVVRMRASLVVAVIPLAWGAFATERGRLEADEVDQVAGS